MSVEAHTGLLENARDRWVATSSLLLGMIAYTMAIMMANVALPQIMTSLRADLDYAQWILTAFGIAQTVVMPMVGWLTSLWGHRNLYLGSLSLFCLGSTLSALAWSTASLICFRVLTGMGVGLMQPIIMAMLYQIFPPHQRGLAIGLSMVGWSVGPAVGPILGGYLIEAFNWRAAFYISIPLAIGGLVSAFIFLPPLPQPPRRSMDQMGLLTMTVALVTLLMAISQGRREGWGSSYILTLFTIAIGMLLLFLLIEWRKSSPLVELRLFRYLPFTLGCLVVAISTTVFRGTGLLTIIFLQQVLRFTPSDVGWALLAGSIAYGIAVLVAGRLADRINPRLLVITGLGIFSTAFFWFAGVNEVVATPVLIFFLSLRLVSFGVTGSPNNLSAMRGLPEEHVVMGSGLLSLIRSISGTVGTALAAIIYEHRYSYHAQQLADNSSLHLFGFQEALNAVRTTLHWAGEIPATLSLKAHVLLRQRLLTEATIAAYQDYFLFAALVGVLAMIAALPFPELVDVLHRARRRYLLSPTLRRDSREERSPQAEQKAILPVPGALKISRSIRK
ncbi:MAG: DHA2 family efflux MFS transporter permease subunit [Nitrospinota bacterium]|nr:MAG: DHA2 family efflux MFS transporter permease subunit [Nitrospinota bacterium]